MTYNAMFRSPFAPRIHFDEAAGSAAAGGDGGAAAAAAASAAAAKPWYEGKVDGELLGWMQNRGWDKDPVNGLIEATKAHRELQKHVGVSADRLLRLPEKADDEAGWNAVRQRLGMPKEAKEYDFSTVKWADGADLDQSFTDTMRAALHKAGTPKDAAPEIAKAVIKYLGDAETTEATAKATALKADREALQKEWGSNAEFNRLTAMQGAKRAFGTEEKAAEVIAAMEQAIGYKNTMEFWRKIGAGTTEDTFIEAGGSGSPVTANGAKARMDELKSDPDWVKRYLAGSQKEVAEMNNLIQLASAA